MLFKYLKNEHLREFMKTGAIKLGTLHKYRDVETLGQVIGDENEGIIEKYRHIKKRFLTHDTTDPFLDKVIKISGGGNAIITNTLAVHKHVSPDLYIFSTTEIFDLNLLKDFGYDSCYQINDPLEFYKIITNKLGKFAKPLGIHRCVYGDKMIPSDLNPITHPAVLKDMIYEPQKEVRMIWQAINNSPKPKIIRCKRNIKLTSIVKIK